MSRSSDGTGLGGSDGSVGSVGSDGSGASDLGRRLRALGEQAPSPAAPEQLLAAVSGRARRVRALQGAAVVGALLLVPASIATGAVLSGEPGGAVVTAASSASPASSPSSTPGQGSRSGGAGGDAAAGPAEQQVPSLPEPAGTKAPPPQPAPVATPPPTAPQGRVAPVPPAPSVAPAPPVAVPPTSPSVTTPPAATPPAAPLPDTTPGVPAPPAPPAPLPPAAGLTGSLSGSATVTVDQPATYALAWSDGDGQFWGDTEEWGDGVALGSTIAQVPCGDAPPRSPGAATRVFSHTWSEPGTYQVQLSVSTQSCTGPVETVRESIQVVVVPAG